IVESINHEIRAALVLPDVAKRLAEGGNVASPSTPEEMRRKIEGDIARWRRVIETAGIKTEERRRLVGWAKSPHDLTAWGKAHWRFCPRGETAQCAFAHPTRDEIRRARRRWRFQKLDTRPATPACGCSATATVTACCFSTARAAGPPGVHSCKASPA